MAQTFGIDPSLPRKVLMTTLRNVARPAQAFDADKLKAEIRAEIKAESDAATAHKMGADITERAVKFGMTFANDAERTAFAAFAAGNQSAAESVLKALPGARLMGRLTTGGAPIGTKVDATERTETPSGARVIGMSLSTAAKKLLADGKATDIGAAQVMAIRANPALANE